MVSVTVYMDPGQAEQLTQLNEATRVPVAVYVREGIDLVLLREEEKLARLERERQLKISFTEPSGKGDAAKADKEGKNK